MHIKEIKAAIECILFVSGDPVSINEFHKVFDIDKSTFKKIMNQLIDYYNAEDKGLKIIEIEGSYQFTTKTKYYKYIERLLRPKANTGLSKASLETLSIIAYKQPITKAKVDGIRGVKSSSCLSSLIEKKLIIETGRLETPGRPILYGTTENFLRLFGLSTLRDLPPVKENYE